MAPTKSENMADPLDKGIFLFTVCFLFFLVVGGGG